MRDEMTKLDDVTMDETVNDFLTDEIVMTGDLMLDEVV